MKKSVIGIVETQVQAERVVDDLQASGVPSTDISVVFPDTRSTKDFAHEHNTKAPEGAVAGVSAGGVIGGTVGLLAGIGAVAGALVGLGIPEIEAKTYEGKIHGGNILIAVHTENSETEKRAKRTFE